MNSPGIYKILNKVTGDFYIGSAARTIKVRWIEHRKNLRKNRHCNKHLQSSWNKYTETNFEIIVLEETSPEDCIIREQFYIDTLKPTFNKSPVAGSQYGFRFSEEQKQKMREEKLEYFKHNPAPMKGRIFSEEHRENLKKSHIGYKASEEQRQKISKGLKNHIKNNNIDMSLRCKKKPVKCINTGEVFNSVKAAAEYFKLNACHLTVCLKKNKPVKGLIFNYV